MVSTQRLAPVLSEVLVGTGSVYNIGTMKAWRRLYALVRLAMTSVTRTGVLLTHKSDPTVARW